MELHIIVNENERNIECRYILYVKVILISGARGTIRRDVCTKYATG